MRVAVIPTGVMELRGLADALKQLFPGHEFCSVPRVPGRPGWEAEPFDQSNTYRVSAASLDEGLKTNRTTLVQNLAGTVFPPGPKAADLALVLDDLELFNLDQPQVVIEAVRSTVRAHVKKQEPEIARELAQCLRARASYHLAVPMTESWIFADPQGPANSGVSTADTVRLKPGIDPEHFETDDADYVADTGAGCAKLLDRNLRRRESRKAPWVLAPQPYPWFTRERHPKAYLQWLLRDPGENSCTRWKEGKQGADSLRKLDWSAVLSNPSHCTWLRAMIDDLADGLGEPFPVPGVDAPCAQLTRRKRHDASAVLRNL
ncbi:hypothetical protein [Sorangium sp. So ce388]|uniref:hypothetical protein n=1 Tax=Sorangium sp. So ce388 TaxID=3133309 RepID=UPI003F5C2DFB